MNLVATALDQPLAGNVVRVIDADVSAYLEELRVLRRSPATVRMRRYQLGGWLAWLAGQGLSPATASRGDVVAYLGRFVQAETRASNMAAVRGLHGWLAATGRRADDPTQRLPRVRRDAGDPHPCPDPVTLEALRLGTREEQAMIRLGRFAGLRAAEIARAHREQLRGARGWETLRVVGKGGRVRELPAHPEVVGVLVAAEGWVFPSPVGPGPLRAGTVTDKLRELLPGPWTAHSLRHAFASEAYARTKDLRLVQEWLGHADPRTTVRYVQVDRNHDAMRSLRLVA